jgi:hypothetical protein
MIILLVSTKKDFTFVIFILEAYVRKAIAYFVSPFLIKNNSVEVDSGQPYFFTYK